MNLLMGKNRWVLLSAVLLTLNVAAQEGHSPGAQEAEPSDPPPAQVQQGNGYEHEPVVHEAAPSVHHALGIPTDHEVAKLDEKGCPMPVAEAHGGGHGPVDAPTFILHHVSDSESYEFELPWDTHGHNPTLNIAAMFPGLKFEKEACACSKPVPPAWTSFPKLGAWVANGCYDLRPTKTVMMMWLASGLLLLTVLIFAHKDKTKLVPKGAAANIIESMVLFVRDELAIKNIGKQEAHRYTPYLISVFFFILFINWLGLVPNMFTATGNISLTAGLALCTFVLTQMASIRAAGFGGYLAHLTGGLHPALWIIIIPVEFIGLFTKPIALMIRLFANMVAGHIVLFFLLALIFMLHPAMAVVSVPMAVAIFMLEIFVGFVQAFIFTMLSALFIGMGVAMGHHGDEHKEGHGEGHAAAH